jgi:hypothetical protein
MVETSQEVTFVDFLEKKKDDETGNSPSTFLIVELDSEANTPEGETKAKTKFLPGSKAFIRVFGINYKMKSVVGTLIKESTKNSLSIKDETITFTDTKTGFLQYPPSGNVEWEWVGERQGTPKFGFRDVTLVQDALGFLKCTYKTDYDQWSISHNEAESIIVLGTLNEIAKSVTVVFAIEAEEETEEEIAEKDLAAFLKLVLDSEKNGSGSPFAVNAAVYLLCYSSGSEDYTIKTSIGVCTTSQPNLPISISGEVVTFAETKTAILAYPIKTGSISWSWEGINGGIPTFIGRTVIIPEPVTSKLKCNYITLADRWVERYNNEAEVIVTATKGEKIESCEFEYSEEAVDLTPVSYEIETKDYCSGLTVEGVEIIIDNVSIGFTDSS